MVARAEGLHADLLKGRKVAVGEGVTGWVLANRQPFCNADPRLDLSPQLAAHFTGYSTLAAFPLIEGNELHGALTLYSSTLTEYTAEHRRLLEETVKLVAAALKTNPEPIMQPVTTQPLVAATTKLASELAH
jgi:GAF domain-containing protein